MVDSDFITPTDRQALDRKISMQASYLLETAKYVSADVF